MLHVSDRLEYTLDFTSEGNFKAAQFAETWQLRLRDVFARDGGQQRGLALRSPSQVARCCLEVDSSRKLLANL